MKAFHLGAFEVMVVTDNRLSESGSLYQCWGFPEELTAHRAAIDGGCFMDSDALKAIVCDKDSEGCWYFDSLTPACLNLDIVIFCAL